MVRMNSQELAQLIGIKKESLTTQIKRGKKYPFVHQVQKYGRMYLFVVDAEWVQKIKQQKK